MKFSRKIGFFLVLSLLLLYPLSLSVCCAENYRIDAGSRPVTYFVPASLKNYRSGDRGPADINYLVIHTVQGSLGSAINTFESRGLNKPRSAHYIVGRDGKVVKTVSPENIAWHAGTSPPGSGGNHESNVLNANSIGVEHGGFVSEEPTREQYISSAALVSLLCELYRIPKDRDHIVGHEEIKEAKGDPGSNWDWDLYMKLVKHGSPEEKERFRLEKQAPRESLVRTSLGLGLMVGGTLLSLIAFN